LSEPNSSAKPTCFDGLISSLKVKNEGVNLMLAVLNYRENNLNSAEQNVNIINLEPKEKRFTSFYNLLEQSTQELPPHCYYDK
jgi:hypothetical protein